MIDTAIILAGGLGTRLRPLTNDTPKPLLPIKGKPILQHSIERLKKYGVTNIIISIGYKADVVQKYFGDGTKFGVDITYALETEPLGTGGAIKLAAKGLEQPLFLVWGDNLMDIDYDAMYKSYLREAPQITMLLTPREDVEHFGVAKLEGSKIMTFVEKPARKEAPSNLINGGAFIIEPKCLEILPEGKSSMERDCFEKLAPLGEISAYTHAGQWFPTDTLEKYALASKNFQPEIDLSAKKIIIADVDDTICESCQKISPPMAEQIDKLIDKGYTFAFISGTKAEDLQNMLSAIKGEIHILATTGTKYVKVNGTAEVIYNHDFTLEEKQEIIHAFKLLITKYNIETMTTKEDQLQDRDSQITLSAIGRNAPLPLKASYDPDGSKRKKWIEFLQKQLPDKYSLKIGGTTSIDITRKGLDKEWGIREFVKFHGINLSDVLFFGDKIYPGGNDYAAAKIVDCISVENPFQTLRELKKL